MRTCTRCAESKPTSEFSPKRGSGFRARCKRCEADLTRERRLALTPEERRLRDAEGNRRWLDANPERRRAAWRRVALRAFGLTPEDYDRMLAEQDGRCAICRTDSPGEGRQVFAVDHDHSTGLVRGLLCGQCNRALGLFGDNPQNLSAAITYLDRHAKAA